VRTWSSIVWAISVIVIGVVESDAQTPPACFVVEIPSDPDPFPNNTSRELARLYAKAEPAESSTMVTATLTSRQTGAITRESKRQVDIAATLSDRERAFLSGQRWTAYCPLNVVSQPAPPTLASHQASDLSSREAARPRIVTTRIAFAGQQLNAMRRHEWRIRGRGHYHLQAQVRSIGRHSRATTLLRRS
jgi:hypothetical protein